MEKRLVKFIWGSSDRIKGDWHLGLWGHYDRLPGLRRSGLAISCRGLLGWGAGLALGFYLIGATVLYTTFRRNPYNLVSYVDTLLLPLRWSHVREVRGRMLIEEGLADLKAKRWAEAGMKLRSGLSRAPHELRARLELARFYAAVNRRASALTLLTEDLGHGYPGRPYLESLFELATDGEDFDVIIVACDRFRTEPADRAWRTVQRILALLRAHRAAEVLALTTNSEEITETTKEARVTALLDLKRPVQALGELALWQREPGPSQGLILRLQVRALREAGEWAQMDQAMERYRQLAPTQPRVNAYLVVQQWLAGREGAAAAALDEYFRRFSSSAENILIAMQGLGEAKAAALVQRCAEEGAAHGFTKRSFKLPLLQAQLSAGDWRAAVRTLEDVRGLATAPDPKEAFMLEWATHLLALAARPDEVPEAALLEFFQRRRVSMRVYRQSCEVLVHMGRPETARRVLELGGRAFPASQTLDALRAQLEKALETAPRPSTAVDVAEPPRPRGEKVFFEIMAEARRARRWAEAAEAIREVRITKPQWLAARETEVLELQVRVSSALGETLEMLGAAKQILDGSATRAARMVALAREFGDDGNRVDGERLLQEVLRRNPGFPLALRLREEWRSKPAAGELRGTAQATCGRDGPPSGPREDRQAAKIA